MSDLIAAGLGRPAVGDGAARERAVFNGYLDDADKALLVAEADGAVVGVASLSFRPRLNLPTQEAWLSELAVDARFRRRGVARTLVEACLELARARACHLLRLECRFERAGAHAFYDGMGFTRTGYDYRRPLEAG